MHGNLHRVHETHKLVIQTTTLRGCVARTCVLYATVQTFLFQTTYVQLRPKLFRGYNIDLLEGLGEPFAGLAVEASHVPRSRWAKRKIACGTTDSDTAVP